MDKVASPQQLVTETRRLLAYAESAQPSRAIMAHQLRVLADRVAGRVFVSNTPLYGHISMATAYLVDDYPYGFRLRTKIRYWLETDPKKGSRFVSQTMNPKTGGWNAPKKSTYARLGAVMYLDSQNHVEWTGLQEGTSPSKIQEFLLKYPKAERTPLLKAHVKREMALAFAFMEGKAHMTMNGVRIPVTEEDMGRYQDDAEQWHELSTYL